MGVFNCISLAVLLALTDPNGAVILEKVDNFLSPWPSFSVDVQLKDSKAVHYWRMLRRGNGDLRMEGLSDKENGHSVLLLGDEMWLLFPSVKRPVKVSPQQKLIGATAGSEIARARFSKDFEIESIHITELGGGPCYCLTLKADSQSLRYQTVKLWVAKESELPLQAEYFLLSGKLAKIIKFGLPRKEKGSSVIQSLEVKEANGEEIHLEFTHWLPGKLPDEKFELPKG